jgi:hypothetical protein
MAMDTLDLTKSQQLSESTTKMKTHPKEWKNQAQKTKLRNSLNNSDSHTHFRNLQQTCIALTIYNNIPTDFISSQNWL